MSNAKGEGLSDVIAGSTRICTVGVEGKGLSYRGYRIEDLAKQATFEEVAYLLLYGELPTEAALCEYKKTLRTMRSLPPVLTRVLALIPASSHPMDVMRTITSVLGNIEPEMNFESQRQVANRLLAIYPGALLYWYHVSHYQNKIHWDSEEDNLAAHFLFLLNGKKPSALEVQAMDVSLLLYAEHEFNASTFAARVAASTLTDFYSAITAGIATLRGALHGGANESAMALIRQFTSLDDVEPKLDTMLRNKEKIMGFGHRVYRESDPRNTIIKPWSYRLAQDKGDEFYYLVSEIIEKTLWERKKLFPNLDFYSATAYYYMNIPVSLYTPIFVFSRITGWAAHIFEQRGNNALIRPSATYIGPEPRPYLPLAERR